MKPHRVWPGVALAGVMVVTTFVAPLFVSDFPIRIAGGAVCALLLMLWWLLFSRARWFERLGAAVVVIALTAMMKPVVHPSIAGGAQGMLSYIMGIQPLLLALALWAAMARNITGTKRLATFAVAMAIGCLPINLIRTEGVMGGDFVMKWRWSPTPEQLLLAQEHNEELKPLPAAVPAPAVAPAETPAATPDESPSAVPPATAAIETLEKPAPAAAVDVPAEWPGFRGPKRDGVVRGVRIKTDWAAAPPVQMWRRPIGPGWSSFSVRGDLLYTQEQRGDEEIVACYRVSSGEPVWKHRDPIRFYESNGGAGPRGTPTISRDRIYSMGATGVVNALDANTGRRIWSQDAARDTKREIPMWGISSSPLVVDDVVIVSLAGTLIAYDAATGRQRWIGPQHGGSYSSPHLATIDGVRQVVILSAPGAVSVNPADGSLLWEHRWEGGAIVQPAVTPEGDILINAMAATGGLGTRRLAITNGANGWTVEEQWTSNGLKPYFNDFVLHNGHAYGFDGNILAAIDLADGTRKWKGGRYGNGQMLLLADQDVLLVIAEEGELALVSATTDGFKELARFKALDAKTWNHPVVVGNTLLVRNGEEMAAFRLVTEAVPATTDAIRER